MPGTQVLIVNGSAALARIEQQYQKILREYNEKLQKLHKRYYLKPKHTVYTRRGRRVYTYHGRYWWKIEYLGRKGKASRIRWHYVPLGSTPKSVDASDPPQNPLQGLKYQKFSNGDLLMDEAIFEKFKHVFQNCPVFHIIK
ncbi:hypothetical protein KEJ26_02905 [Candidatus Bathyarchaeota archaeon]|nr:hypothetical protein [Candidatus Bathyarchaeota archaeon]